MELQQKTEDKDMIKVMSTSRGTVSQVPNKFVEKEEREQEDGYKYRPLHKPYTWTYQWMCTFMEEEGEC